MRTIVDREGVHWQVAEANRHGVGASAPSGDASPQATFASVVFKSTDGRRVSWVAAGRRGGEYARRPTPAVSLVTEAATPVEGATDRIP